MRSGFRGYDRDEVDALLARCARALGPDVGRHPELAAHARSLQAVAPVTAAEVAAARFSQVFRGYDVQEVDELLDRVAQSLAARVGEPAPTPAPGLAAPGEDLGLGRLPVSFRGYDRRAVDAYLVRCAHSLGERVVEVPELEGLDALPAPGGPVGPKDVAHVQFPQAWRGYAIIAVDDLLDRVERALAR